MPLEMRFKNNLKDFKVIWQGNYILSEYYKIIIYNLIKYFTGKTSFGIILNKDNKDELLVIINGKRVLNIIVKPDEFIIKDNNYIYTYKPFYQTDATIINLSKVIKVNDNNKIIEEFKPHLVDIKIVIKDLTYELLIPYDTDYILDYNLFNSLNKTTCSLAELISFYQKVIAPNQEGYNYQDLTAINIYQNHILQKSVGLREGHPTIVKINKQIDDVKFSITKKINEQAEITIEGMTLDSSIDLNTEIKAILKEIELLLNKGYLRVLK